MHLALDHLAAAAADEFLLDETDLLLAEGDGNDIADIRWETAPPPFPAGGRPRDAVWSARPTYRAFPGPPSLPAGEGAGGRAPGSALGFGGRHAQLLSQRAIQRRDCATGALDRRADFLALG